MCFIGALVIAYEEYHILFCFYPRLMIRLINIIMIIIMGHYIKVSDLRSPDKSY